MHARAARHLHCEKQFALLLSTTGRSPREHAHTSARCANGIARRALHRVETEKRDEQQPSHHHDPSFQTHAPKGACARGSHFEFV
jgi:hypothetical protein